MRVMHRFRAGNPPHPRCPLGQGGGSWRVAEVGAEGTVPGYPQSMGLLCRVPVPPGASWDPGGVVGATTEAPLSLGMHLTPSQLPPSTAVPQFGGARQAGDAARGCRRSFLSHAAAAGAASCSPQGAHGWTTALGKGSELQGAGGTPRQSPAGAGSWAAGSFPKPEAPPPPRCPSPWHRACGLGWGAESRMSPLPPSPLPGGETEAREHFPRPGRVSMEMGAGVQAPSCRSPPNKGESGTLMGARPPGRASQPRPKITPPGERWASSRLGPNPAAGRGPREAAPATGVTPGPACRRPPRPPHPPASPAPLRWGRGGTAGRIESGTEGGGESHSLRPAGGRPEPPCPLLGGNIWGEQVWGASP